MKNKKILLGLGLLLTSSVVMTGCGENKKVEDTKNTTNTQTVQKTEESNKDKNTEKVDDKDAKKVTLEKWQGKWNDMSLYLDDEKLNSAFDRLAKQENKSVEDAKNDYKKKRECNFGGLEINGDTITFYDNFMDKDGKEISKSDYEFVKEHKMMHGKHELTWYEFKSKDTSAKYPVMMLMDVHSDDDELKHFHFRYGDNAEEILKKDGWFPAVVDPSSTFEQLEEEITE